MKRMSEATSSKLEPEVAQERLKEQADKHRREAPGWDVGDQVVVSTENLKGCNKLKQK